MFRRILVVCEGNICRSPVAASILQQALPGSEVTSAGLRALVDEETDPDMVSIAEAEGIRCLPHRARQLSDSMCSNADLILVMDDSQRQKIRYQWPMFSGKVMLLGAWCASKSVPDPYRQSRDFQLAVLKQIKQACESWAEKLKERT